MVRAMPRLIHHCWLVVISLGCVLSSKVLLSAQESSHEIGKQLYERLCAECHGKQGEGVADQFPNRLVGTKSLADLQRYIDQAMPPDHPESCQGEEATQVANFVWMHFYGPDANTELNAPRVELRRLTNQQYVETIADLVVGLVGPNTLPQERGLEGNYRKAGGKDGLRRIDAVLDFDFGTASPAPEAIDTEEYSVTWQGGIAATESGEYEFRIRSLNGVRLWVNDSIEPLIDATVRSGEDQEHTAQRHLLGGRIYPVRIELKKGKAESANIQFAWRPPHQVWEVIPHRALHVGRFREIPIVTTPLPPDDRSFGFERGVSMTDDWQEAMMKSALEVASWIERHQRILTNIQEKDSPDVQRNKMQVMLEKFVVYALGRPMTELDRTRMGLSSAQANGWNGDEVKRLVTRTLLSPDFLYPGLPSNPPAISTAQRLSLMLWDSKPDAELLRVAAEGQLLDEPQLRRQVERMVAMPATQAKLKRFLRRWLQWERSDSMSRDQALFPGFDEALISDLRTSMNLTMDDWVSRRESSLHDLFLMDQFYVNARIASYYQLAPVESSEFVLRSFANEERKGVISHPFLMANLSYHRTSSPIHRGVFLAKEVLGHVLRNPPNAVAPLDDESHPELSTRERITLQTEPEACQACHSLINPLGFALENFDATGRFRTQEKGRPIDAISSYLAKDGTRVTLNGPLDLATFLAEHPDVQQSMVEQLIHYFLQQSQLAYGPDTIDRICKSAGERQPIRTLLTELAVTMALNQP